MLINQHTILFGNQLQHPRHIGSIDPSCDVVNIVKDAYANARYLCEVRAYMSGTTVYTACKGGVWAWGCCALWRDGNWEFAGRSVPLVRQFGMRNKRPKCLFYCTWGSLVYMRFILDLVLSLFPPLPSKSITTPALRKWTSSLATPSDKTNSCIYLTSLRIFTTFSLSSSKMLWERSSSIMMATSQPCFNWFRLL